MSQSIQKWKRWKMRYIRGKGGGETIQAYSHLASPYIESDLKKKFMSQHEIEKKERSNHDMKFFPWSRHDEGIGYMLLNCLSCPLSSYVPHFFFKSDPIHAYITTHWVDHKASKELWTQVSPLLVTFQAHISRRSSGVWGKKSVL